MTDLDVAHDVSVADRLGRSYAVWRLRPGDLEQESFLAACDRLSDVLSPRLGMTLGVRGAGFVTAGGDRVDARAAGALAEALYRIGIERLRLHRPPTPAELDRFLDAIDTAADREDLHDRLGPVNAVLEPISVAPTTVGRDRPEELEGWRETWELLADPASAARVVLPDAPTDAAGIVRRMMDLRNELPPDRQRSPVLADRLHALVVHLPDEVRTAVARNLVASPDAAFPGWFLCSLTDHDLGLLLEGVEDDVPALARRALGRELGDLSTEVAVPVAGARPARTPPSDPAGSAGDAPLGVGSIELFLRLEHRPERLRAALLHWQRRVRAALHDDRLEDVHDLLAVLHRVAAVSEHDEVLPVLDAAVGATLGDEEVAALLPDAGEVLPPRTKELLRSFGFAAIDALMGRLVHEEEAQRRAQLVSVLAVLVPGNTNALGAWVDDPRWFVVRNVVTALWRAGDPAALPLLRRTITNPEARVRLETARALAGLGEVTELARLAGDRDAEVRTSARRMLTGLGSPDAAAALAGLAHQDGVTSADRRNVIDALADHPHGRAHLRTLADDPNLPKRLRWHAGRVVSGR